MRLASAAAALAFAAALAGGQLLASEGDSLPMVCRDETGQPVACPPSGSFDGNVVPGRLLVRFKPDQVRLPEGTASIDPNALSDAALAAYVPSRGVRDVLRRNAVHVLRRVFARARPTGLAEADLVDWMVLDMPTTANLRAVADQLARTGHVVIVEPDRIVQVH